MCTRCTLWLSRITSRRQIFWVTVDETASHQLIVISALSSSNKAGYVSADALQDMFYLFKGLLHHQCPDDEVAQRLTDGDVIIKIKFHSFNFTLVNDYTNQELFIRKSLHYKHTSLIALLI